MKTKEFLENLLELVRQQLPPELSGFQVKGPITSLIKLHYEIPSVHYEVWIQRRKGQVEVGLHFEGDPESNARSLELLRHRAGEVLSALGDDIEFERWDRGWTRVHHTLPLEPLADDFLVEVSFKLSGMMRILEPLRRGVIAPTTSE